MKSTNTSTVFCCIGVLKNVMKKEVLTMDFDLKKCKTCTEKRCDLAFLQKTEKTDAEKEEIKFQLKLIEIKEQKIHDYWIREKKYWNKFKNREMALINYDRKPYMNSSDWMHDANWFIGITKLMELDKLYYKGLEDLYTEKLEINRK